MSTPDHEHATARVVRHEVEVPGTPEDVWRAIATGPGIATWFTPAEVEEREGGAIVTHHGPYGDSVGTVTSWEPPRRFAYTEPDWLPDEPDAPPWATEILVEARSGGTCVVRLVSGFFRGGEGWEDQLKGTDEGWWWGLRNLQLYLTHFAGEPAANLWAMSTVSGKHSEVHANLIGALGLDGLAPGEAFDAPNGAPPLAGIVEDVHPSGLLLRTSEPSPGLFHVNTWAHDSHTSIDPSADVMVSVGGYLYGEVAAEIAEREQPRWDAWLKEKGVV